MGCAFRCRVPEETPDAVVGDRMRLQQVLLNLAGNAIKFTERGEVEISLRALSEDGEACLEFAVRNTGIGISPSGQERLFQPFSQSDPSMSRKRQRIASGYCRPISAAGPSSLATNRTGRIR